MKVHQNARDMQKGNTQMRIHNYPALSPGSEVKPGQLRCGEHHDFGSITLLFADRLGGLQVICNIILMFVILSIMYIFTVVL